MFLSLQNTSYQAPRKYVTRHAHAELLPIRRYVLDVPRVGVIIQPGLYVGVLVQRLLVG